MNTICISSIGITKVSVENSCERMRHSGIRIPFCPQLQINGTVESNTSNGMSICMEGQLRIRPAEGLEESWIDGNWLKENPGIPISLKRMKQRERKG